MPLGNATLPERERETKEMPVGELNMDFDAFREHDSVSVPATRIVPLALTGLGGRHGTEPLLDCIGIPNPNKLRRKL